MTSTMAEGKYLSATDMPEIDFVTKISARLHFCREAALVHVRNGKGIVRMARRPRESMGDLFCGASSLVSGGNKISDIPGFVGVDSELNLPYEGLEVATKRLEPLLSLCPSGYYIIADMVQFARVQSTSAGFCDGDFIAQKGSQQFGGARYFMSEEVGYFEAHYSPLFLWASESAGNMDWDRVEYYMETFLSAKDDSVLPRATAVYLNGAISLLLDGHHRAAASAMTGRGLNCTLIFKVSDSEAIAKALEMGEKIAFNAFGVSMRSCDEEIKYWIWDGVCAPYIADKSGRRLSSVESLEYVNTIEVANRVDPVPKVSNVSDKFLDKYHPPVQPFTQDLLETATSIDISRIRTTIASVKTAMQRISRAMGSANAYSLDRGEYDNIKAVRKIIRILCAYRKVFPAFKWITESEAEWLKRMDMRFDSW